LTGELMALVWGPQSGPGLEMVLELEFPGRGELLLLAWDWQLQQTLAQERIATLGVKWRWVLPQA